MGLMPMEGTELMKEIIRIGKISTIDYAKGTASVIFTDRSNEASPNFPFFSMFYEMPKVDDTVVVIMLPNSATKGFIIGVPFSAKRIPAKSGQGIFHKEFYDGTSILYNPETKNMEISAPKITLKSVTADSLDVRGEIKAKAIKAEKIIVEEMEVSGTAKINNLELSGTVTGLFQD